MQTAAKPVPKSPVQVVNTAWQPSERNVKRLARSELLNILLHHWDEGGEVALHITPMAMQPGSSSAAR